MSDPTEGPLAEAPKMSASTLTHVALRTHDVEASVSFYQRYAGLQVVHRRVDAETHVVWLAARPKDPDLVIVLLGMPHGVNPDPAPMDHLGFAVASRKDVDRIAELARGEGRLRLGPSEGGPIVGYIVMLQDPSGNVCEFSHGQSIAPG